jgi:hypothetical protein
LGARIAAEILPENMLARTPDMITWWVQAAREVMFFGGVEPEAGELDARIYPHPALVFKVTRRELFVRAMEKGGRPRGETPRRPLPIGIATPPAGFVWAQCVSQMKPQLSRWPVGRPVSSGANSPPRMEQCGSPVIQADSLWKSPKNSQLSFPTEFLTDAKETLRQFVERE